MGHIPISEIHEYTVKIRRDKTVNPSQNFNEKRLFYDFLD